MVSAKSRGFLILIICPILFLAYILGLMYATTLILELTAALAIFVVLSAFIWVGYTMLTSSPPPETAGQLDSNLEAETINPDHTFDESCLSFPKFSVIVDAEIGSGTIVRDHVNLYKCKIGKNCKIESFVYVEEGVIIGDNCKVKPHVYIPTGVTIEDEVFLGPNVTFTNDKYPHTKGDWKLLKTLVKREVSIGANSVILPGVTIGTNAVVGSGSVVTSDVPDGATVCGNPAKPMKE